MKAIVAVDRNNAIGKDNDLPWKLKGDMKHFVATTKNKTVVMGRKTYESIGKPLPNRQNIVITRDSDLVIDGVDVVNSIDEVKSIAQNAIVIIGGGEIYSLFAKEIKEFWVTEVKTEIENADTFCLPLWHNMEEVCTFYNNDEYLNYTIRLYKRSDYERMC